MSGTGRQPKVLFRAPTVQMDGHNAGRIYHLRAGSEGECLRVARLLAESSKRARKLREARGRLLKLQARCALGMQAHAVTSEFGRSSASQCAKIGGWT